MKRKLWITLSVVLSLVFVNCEAMAQRGGRGGGGGGGRGGAGGAGGGMSRGGGGGEMNRGGSPGGEAGGMNRGGAGGFGGGGFGGGAGGFGGGLPGKGPSGEPGRGSEGIGPYGRPGSGGVGGPASGVGARPGMGAGSAGARPGMGAGGVGGPASGVGVRPGMGAGGAGGPASGVGVRPGMGAGGVGGPASGVGVRPGMGAGGLGGPASGVGVLPGMGAGGLGGPDSGIGVRPGMGAGYAGAPMAYGAARAGTYYASSAALAEQGAAFRRSAVGYADYSTAMMANYANAWTASNMIGNSYYTHPGYNNLAVGLGMAAAPVSYDYGSNVVSQSDTMYVNGDAAGSQQEYADQATQLASSGQTSQPADDTKWLPLGVFAVVEGNATTSDDVFQLAVDKQGIIRGNYHNTKADSMDPITGSVDKKSQRAAWTIGSDKTPVYEAGIVNLTKDQTPILVHLEDGTSKQMTLIRLQDPSQANSGSSESAGSQN